MAKPKKNPAKAAKASDITIEQYSMGLEMARCGASENRIQSATGMTKAQLNWCCTIGNDIMPPWVGVLEREAAALRSSALEIAKSASLKSLQIINSGMDIVAAAQDSYKLILYAHREEVIKEAKAAKAEGRPIDLDAAALPASARETLKVLKQASSMDSTSRVIQTILGMTGELMMQFRQPGTKESRAALSHEAMLPAIVTQTEPQKESAGAMLDPVETLLSGDLENWDDKDFEQYLSKYDDVLGSDDAEPEADEEFDEDDL